ncbi:hypothetical protein P8C59_000146 [Phyllachora maydis]|uniref:Uncharacterized protein n=1 Tax=Phyllachora maydis TaxID=1825666 RepID=A0AAD9M755_9PEZI|nr:hypothetical protein P8C59_000146 [Phyllachora maydis]
MPLGKIKKKSNFFFSYLYVQREWRKWRKGNAREVTVAVATPSRRQHGFEEARAQALHRHRTGGDSGCLRFAPISGHQPTPSWSLPTCTARGSDRLDTRRFAVCSPYVRPHETRNYTRPPRLERCSRVLSRTSLPPQRGNSLGLGVRPSPCLIPIQLRLYAATAPYNHTLNLYHFGRPTVDKLITKSSSFHVDRTSNGVTSTIVLTVTTTHSAVPTGATAGSASAPTSSSGSLIGGDDTSSDEGPDNGGKIAIAVVVPIAAVALFILAGIYLWRKHKQRRDAEEQRRKEVEEYGYNPNADPTIAVVAASGASSEMKEDASSGYRGWGSTTLAGSSRKKPSTTMSGGATAGAAYTNAPSPTRANQSDTRSAENPMNDMSCSPEGVILGAMGPPAADNRGGNVHRGLSNSSSSYSATGRSDGSGEGPIGVAYSGDPGNYNQYGHGNPNLYTDGTTNSYQGPAEVGGQPVIRDVAARRNTRIENPAHFPQQSVGISQNF